MRRQGGGQQPRYPRLATCWRITKERFCNFSGVKYILKSLFLSVFKIRNLKTLLYRFFTIFMVICHYTFVEKISYEHMLDNQQAFATLIVVWHWIFMNFKILEESRRKKTSDNFNQMAIIGGIFGLGVLITVLFTPILSYFDYEVTRLVNSYYTWRYILLLLYILMNIAISVFPLVNNFMFFLSDGIILSQLTTLYLYNEFSMSALLTILPFLFVLQNHGLIKGIKNFPRDETNSKLSFVRLIGRHDAVFLYVIYTLFTLLFNIVDFFSSNYIFAINFWYLIYALYVFGRLMDNRKIGGLKYVSFLSVLAYGVIYCYTIQYHQNPFPNRTFPLYNPCHEVIVENANATLGDSNMTALINTTMGLDNATFDVNNTIPTAVGGEL